MMEQRTIYNDAQIGIPGYTSGAKTGSARLASTSGGYSGQVASIVGVAPVDDPQILVYVLVARPDTEGAGLGHGGPGLQGHHEPGASPLWCDAQR
jgi:cell division protein FtsI (penicillin-binding protein 3)